MRFILGIFFYLAALLATAQIQDLSTLDFDVENSKDLFLTKISPDGNWAIFFESKPNDVSEYYLTSTDKSYIKKIEGQNFSFSANSSYFAYLNTESELILWNLKKFKIQKFSSITNYSFSNSGKYLLFQDSNNRITVLNTLNNSIKTKNNIESFEWSPSEDTVILLEANNNSIKILSLSFKKDRIENKEIDSLHTGQIEGLYWSKLGNSFLVFGNKSENNFVNFYDLLGEKFILNDSIVNHILYKHKLTKYELEISDNAKTVMLKIHDEQNQINDGVEIWDTTDKMIFPKKKSLVNNELSFKTLVWHPYEGKCFVLNKLENSLIKGHPNFSHSILYTPLKYGPNYKQNENVDVFLIDNTTGKYELALENFYFDRRYISISSRGNYLSFFKDKDWWVYNIETKKKNNLTKNINGLFYDIESPEQYEKKPYGIAGWTANEKFLIIYDKYDIWLISPDGKTHKKITDGRNSKVQYRINREFRRNNNYLLKNLKNFYTLEINPKDSPIFLDMLGEDLKTGFAIWDSKDNIRTLIYSKNQKDQLLTSDDKKQIVFTQRKYNYPTALYTMKLKSDSTPRKIHQINKGLLNLDLGKYEFIKYNDKNGNKLKGLLLYPSGFNPENKYPLITYIYENNTAFFNLYHPPTLYDTRGFNILNYILNGYFILLPDIKYEIGNPGVSALDCVVSAVNQSLTTSYIDKDRIGLIGHSFGGYEATFISTQTKMFRTVVAGAPVTDLISFYHDVQWGWRDIQATRLENHQFRMGSSYYENKVNYLRNSPLHFVENVQVPILLWTGNKDSNINWYQSILFFSALRRLNKEGQLIIMDDLHSLTHQNNQAFLSKYIFDWFELYLKIKKE